MLRRMQSRGLRAAMCRLLQPSHSIPSIGRRRPWSWTPPTSDIACGDYSEISSLLMTYAMALGQHARPFYSRLAKPSFPSLLCSVNAPCSFIHSGMKLHHRRSNATCYQYQETAPDLVRKGHLGGGPDGSAARAWPAAVRERQWRVRKMR